MDRQLLRYYNRELLHLRESAAEFAREFPKIAGRLGMEGMEVADPYVERLLEGFAYLTARVQLKLDSEFPRFTQGLLDTIYPHYLAPTPSMAIVQFKPDPAEGSLADGFTLARGRSMRSTIGKGDATACEYRTAHDVTLWPLEVDKADYVTRGLGALGVPDLSGAKAALRIRLRTTAGLKFADLKLDRLVFFLSGADQAPMRIHEQVLAHTLAVGVQPVRTPVPWHEPASGGPAAVRGVGFAEEEALLPFDARSFHGYRLLHEYFVLPQRFLFVEVGGLAAGLKKCAENQLDLIILLREVNLDLENAVSAANFQLFCTPAINLFPKRTDRVHVSDRFSEFHIVADRTRPLDFEVYQVKSVEGFSESGGPVQGQEFLPFYAAVDDGFGGSESRAYFSINRLPRTASAKEEQFGRRSSYPGSEVFVSLVDARAAPYAADIRQLGVTALCTNRDLPLRMPVGRGATDFTMEEGAPVQSIRVLSGPTPPKPSFAEGETAWRIISHLSLNYLSLADTDSAQGAAALRDLLRLYADIGEAPIRKQIDGLKSIKRRPVTRRVATPGPIAFARGLELTVTLDEAAFEGTGVFILGAVLDHFFARYVSLNSFTETVVRTPDRGEIIRWPPRIGRRQIV